jgi:hypothetical protein
MCQLMADSLLDKSIEIVFQQYPVDANTILAKDCLPSSTPTQIISDNRLREWSAPMALGYRQKSLNTICHHSLGQGLHVNSG